MRNMELQTGIIEDLSDSNISLSRAHDSKLWKPFKRDRAFNMTQEPTITEKIEPTCSKSNWLVGRSHHELRFQALRECSYRVLNGIRHRLRPSVLSHLLRQAAEHYAH